MNTRIAIVVLCISSAFGDYIQSAIFGTDATCAGNPAAVSSSGFGCNLNGDSSYEIQCVDQTVANILSYQSTNCTGASFVFPFDAGFGCIQESNTSSVRLNCISGEFVAPSPAVYILKFIPRLALNSTVHINVGK